MEESGYERWEYLTETITADAKEQTAFLQLRYPDVRFPKFAAQALMPRLNALGEEGWELVYMEPVIVGGNGDVAPPEQANKYAATYLCAFKRRKRY